MLDLLEQDAHNALGMIDLNGDLKRLSSEPTEPLVQEHLNTLMDSFYRIIALCTNTPEANFDDHHALSLMVFYQNAEHSSNFLSSYQPQNMALVGLVTNVSQWFKTTIIPFIKNVGRKILLILTSMTTPKEWSVKGHAGAIGLSSLELQIKFGK